MIRQLAFSNRQKTCKVDLRLLRRVARHLLEEFFKAESYDLGVNLIGSRKSRRLNETYLRHEGPTDIITFNYAEPDSSVRFHGELFICVDVAVEQARRFRTTWQRELVRYLVHGLLHLDGYDDNTPEARAIMKRVENKWVKMLDQRFPVDDLQKMR